MTLCELPEVPDEVSFWLAGGQLPSGAGAGLSDYLTGALPVFALPLADRSILPEMVNSEGVTGDIINLAHPRLTLVVENIAGVAAFCTRFGLTIYLRQTLDSVARHFSPTRPVKMSVNQDPEFPDEWLELDVTAAGDPDDVSEAIDRCTTDWLTVAPPHLWSRVRVCVGLG